MLKVRNLILGEGIPKICVPIVGTSVEEILRAGSQIADSPADMAEWRVDWFAQFAQKETVLFVLKKLREQLKDKPLLFTFRTISEGGNAPVEPKQYEALNEWAMDSGEVDFIDVELFMGEELVKRLVSSAHENKIYVIGSSHEFHKTPKKCEIKNRLCSMKSLEMDLCKIAVMPESVQDVMTLMNATIEVKDARKDILLVTISMGTIGKVSRICGELTGSAITFGVLGNSSAPGQMQVEELKKALLLLH